MKNLFLAAVAFAGINALAATAWAYGYGYHQFYKSAARGDGHTQRPALSDQDREFMEKAAVGSMVEAELGRLAAERAESPEVRQFGRRMTRAHAQRGQELNRLAGEIGMPVPKQLDTQDRQTLERLSRLAGRDFDREYMRKMVEDHRRDIDSFKQQAQQGDLPEVKRFAAQSIPALSGHLEMAQNLNQQITAGK